MTTRRIGLVTPSGEIYTKSPRTRRAFRRLLRRNITAALRSHHVDATLHDEAGRLCLVGDASAAAEAAADVFGVRRAAVARPLGATDLDAVVEAAADAARTRVAGRTFAVRVHRRGNRTWRSEQAERRIGSALLDDSAGVHLDDPEVTVRVIAYDDDTFLVEDAHEGPGGLPVGSQDPALLLLSGGFDSAVAGWHVLRRGVPAHFVHFELACSQTDQALAVAHHLWARWAPSTDAVVWVVNFADVRSALLERVESRLRQVRLKELMVRAADDLAARAGIPALATGDSIGQVSSQTLRHLSLVDAASERVILRPLAGCDKDEIVAAARRIGTHDLSLRSRELCDLAEGPVATRARSEDLAPARTGAPDALALDAAAGAWELRLAEWVPGMPSPWAA